MSVFCMSVYYDTSQYIIYRIIYLRNKTHIVQVWPQTITTVQMFSIQLHNYECDIAYIPQLYTFF